MRGVLRGRAEKAIWLCLLSSIATLAYAAYFAGVPVEFIEAVALYAWPLSPYALIAALARKPRGPGFWDGVVLVACISCALTAAVRYIMFSQMAAGDPQYAVMIARLGLMRVPLEQYAVLGVIFLGAWMLARARRK